MAARGKSSSRAASASRGSAAQTQGQRRKVAGDAHRTSLKEREREDASEAVGEGDPESESAPPVDDAGGVAVASEDVATDGGQRGHEPMDGHEPENTRAPENSNESTRGRWRPRRVVLVRVLVGLLVASLLAACGFGVATYLLYNGASASNGAVVDGAATRKVSDDVSRGLQKSFSYDHARPEAAEQDAREVLTGKAIEQYTQLFGQVKQIAPQQQLVLSSTARSIGVTELEDGHARLLAFVDQQGLRGDNNQRRSGTAQLEVSARLVGDTWKIDDIKVL